jgi:tritrans,polycis-undecaprenyl-diphosphate synthase [geranylgeranyl-diphosphate specific]
VTIRGLLEPLYERYLLMQCTQIPMHVAIIQDGNRRFARQAGVNTAQGHRAGADKTEEMLDWAHDLGIRFVTIYSFSTENFRRTDDEIRELFMLFKEKFISTVSDERVRKYRIRVQMVGDRSLLPEDLRIAIEAAEEATKNYDGFTLSVALAYGGRNEIVLAAREIVSAVREGKVAPGAIDRKMVESHLHEGKEIPPVDLIIRTGNEYRTSNFLPWLANGHESAVYFCAPYWPLFRKIDLLRAIRIYDQRMSVRAH